MKHILIKNNFSQHAQQLRKDFERRFKDPLNANTGRFVWDYWHVPDQYTLLRTPAYHFFHQSLYLKFHRELVHWGRKTLGCWDISPPWLSCYVDGCKQELHSDVPHGPWAWVFALTPQRVRFQGGETLILRPEVLSYWNHFHRTQDRELGSFVQRIPSLWNRLVVFDPRYPHGVTEVKGVHDVRLGRLVIHGWFSNPKTYVEGPLKAKAAERKLNQAFDMISDLAGRFPPTQGVASLSLLIGTNGQVQQCRYLSNTVVHIGGEVPQVLNQAILKVYRQLEFPQARAKTQMTIPLIFS